MSIDTARTRPRPERAIDARKRDCTAKVAAVSQAHADGSIATITEPVGVLGGSERQVAYELDRRGDRRCLVAAEGLLGELAKALLVQVVGSDRVLDAEAVDVEQIDAHRRAVAVATPAGDERGDQPADAFASMRVLSVGVAVDLQAGAPAGIE